MIYFHKSINVKIYFSPEPEEEKLLWCFDNFPASHRRAKGVSGRASRMEHQRLFDD
jgi:hypothetical protein